MNSGRPLYGIADLLQVMERLRDPISGCPWDKAQTFSSIVPSTLEECYELAAAIEEEDYPHVAEELGDVLFQVVFYAQLGREMDLFGFEDVVDTLVDKLLRRHPHVFQDGALDKAASKSVSVDEVMLSWEEIKQQEREEKSQPGVLADVPLALPALPRAQKLQKRAAGVGFDWSDAAGVLAKMQEEIAELQAAVAEKSPEKIEDEMGDVLFTAVNLARHLKVDAEASLRRSSMKFESRFGAMERLAAENGQQLEALGSIALDALWNKVKLGS
ncbi:MAG: nucleoside triphosphate pyrophosphohydrolase [Halioglobus sp.]